MSAKEELRNFLKNTGRDVGRHVGDHLAGMAKDRAVEFVQDLVGDYPDDPRLRDASGESALLAGDVIRSGEPPALAILPAAGTSARPARFETRLDAASDFFCAGGVDVTEVGPSLLLLLRFLAGFGGVGTPTSGWCAGTTIGRPCSS